MVLFILSAATAVWIPRQRTLADARATLAETKAQRLNLEQRINAATTELNSSRSELLAQHTSRKQTRSAIDKAERELNKVDPENRWATPPASLPNWNNESPYVWLRKEILPKLPVQAFTENGALNGDVASVLTLDQKQTAALNTTLTNLLAEYHSLEAAKAEKTDEHLPGIAGEKGDKLTIRVQPQPEDGKRIMQQFETALRNELGPQRADLLLQTSESWLDQQFNQSGAEPKTISLIRHPDGSYNLSIKSGGSWFSTGGPWRIIKNQIPVHLRDLFNEMTQPQPDNVSP
ncbi:MAG: hypothetical protein ACXWKH_06040 [Limisphaerales bacterium]